MAQRSSSRRPIDVLVQNYILDCIGSLSELSANSSRVAVQNVFGGGADWKKTLRQAVGFDETVDTVIRERWRVITLEAFRQNRKLEPDLFAETFIAEHLAALLDTTPPDGTA